MSCGISKEVQALKDKMQGEVDGLTKDLAGEAEAGKGLLDQLSSLKAKAEGMIESVSADILAAIPPIPEPLAGLQDKMTGFLDNPTDPGAFVTKLNEMSEKFGTDALNAGLSGLGIDPTEANKQLDKFNKLKEKGQKALNDLSQGTLNILNLPKDISDAIKVAQGDVSSLAGSIEGMMPKGFDPAGALDKLCASVPNLEIAPDGSTVAKGVPISVPSKDGDPAPAPEAAKDVPPPATQQTNQFVKENKSIDVIPMTRKRSDIFQAFRDRCTFQTDNIAPTAKDLKRLIKQAQETGGTVSQNIIDQFNSWRNYFFIYGADSVIELHNEYKNNGLKFKEEHIPTLKIDRPALEQSVPLPEIRAKIEALKYVEILEE